MQDIFLLWHALLGAYRSCLRKAEDVEANVNWSEAGDIWSYKAQNEDIEVEAVLA